jgi:hypothetical protein
MSRPDERATFNPCQNPRCGHAYGQHDYSGGRCSAYHCHCRAWRGLSESEYERGRR